MFAVSVKFHTWQLDKGEEADIEVTREDQNNINAFSKLNGRVDYIEEQLQERKIAGTHDFYFIRCDSQNRTLDLDSQKEKEYLDDLSTELELANEDEPVKFRLADAFLTLPLPQALRRVAKMSEELDQEISDLEADADKWRGEMTGLKATLYGRFGKSINLEK
ncbi:hypothetical protein HDU93_000012 [Gonapodya sp. JEL0774]|nr:hypothetical protein HDU93_000012 [Gonapodya sp. JEL0774]